MKRNGVIIVSPLNWGLGHAARCIPIVEALLKNEFEPVLAGDGASLDLLASEFPSLRTYTLPSYGIRYAKSPGLFKLKLLSQAPGIRKAISREHRIVQEIVAKEKASGIISDNRFGVWSQRVPSVYLTHQVSVKAGFLSTLASFWHRRVISKFDRCWVCDFNGEDGLAKELSSGNGKLQNLDWIGPLSRFSKLEENADNTTEKIEKNIDIGVVLSGPEPSRSQFEKKVIEALKGRKEQVVLIRGIVEPPMETRKNSQKCETDENLTIYKFMLADELERMIRQCRILVMRSGYSSIMDLNALGARALLVPTPGQSEQEYLARRMQEKGWFPTVRQSDFDWHAIQKAIDFSWRETKKTSKQIDDARRFDVFL